MTTDDLWRMSLARQRPQDLVLMFIGLDLARPLKAVLITSPGPAGRGGGAAVRSRAS